MSASFVAASSQRLVNSASPITAIPFTMGFWTNTPNTTGQIIAGIWDTGTDNNYFRLVKTTQFSISAAAGGPESSSAAGTVAPNTWQFLVGRFISATNRRLAVLNADGSTAHVQNTTSRTPSGFDTMAIGAHEGSIPALFLDGRVAEFWVTNTDIQPDAAQLRDALLFQLAYGGPFSVPYIAKDIIEYRSLRKAPASYADDMGEVFHGPLGRQVWTNTNGVTIGPHPPLPYWYAKPPDARPLTCMNLVRNQNWGEGPPPWPPPGDFLQPEMYVNRGTQRW